MLLPLKNTIIKYLSSGYIGPHGMTDYVHAINNNKLFQLHQVYGLTTCSIALLDVSSQYNVINLIFFIFSIIHFQRDLPLKSIYQRYLSITTFVVSCLLYNPDLLYVYMLFIHVPNHYIMNWKILQKNKSLSQTILSVSTFIMILLGDRFFYLTENNFFIDIIKGIIISHILYEELYIYKKSL